MKQIIILSILILSLFLLVSCGNEEVDTSLGTAFIGGTEGVVINFEPISVIDEGGVYSIYDDEGFSLDVILKNRGEEDLQVGKATLRLLGPAQVDFDNIPSWELNNQEIVEKISEFNLEGGEEIISFATNGQAKYKNTVIGELPITWNVEFWYDYKTHLIINDVCFKGDLSEEKVCEVQESRTFSVSGAPIQVTNVAEDTAGKGIVVLKIDIENSGTGESTLVDQEFDRRFSQVAYTVDEPEKWECKSGGRENEARLIEGKAQVICRLKTPLAEEDIYQRSVALTFDYTYRDLIQEKLNIRESVS